MTTHDTQPETVPTSAADNLVSDVVDRLTAGFARARSGLEEQWSRGEQVSTEDLRIALQRHRDFFERFLAV